MKFMEDAAAAVPLVARPSLKSAFLLGGFAASPILQNAVHKAFGHRLQVPASFEIETW